MNLCHNPYSRYLRNVEMEEKTIFLQNSEEKQNSGNQRGYSGQILISVQVGVVKPEEISNRHKEQSLGE